MSDLPVATEIAALCELKRALPDGNILMIAVSYDTDTGIISTRPKLTSKVGPAQLVAAGLRLFEAAALRTTLCNCESCMHIKGIIDTAITKLRAEVGLSTEERVLQ